MENYAPLILEEHKLIIQWSRDMMNEHMQLPQIITALITKTKIKSSDSELLDEVREIYRKGNSSWKEQILKAIMLDRYRLMNDIKDGQIVTNGDEVGFALNVNADQRSFELSIDRHGHEILGIFDMDPFTKVCQHG